MDLIIADFMTHVTTKSTHDICFSLNEMPLSLRVMLAKEGRELTGDEKMRIPVISDAIAACRTRASIDFSFINEKPLEDRLEITIGPDSKDLFKMFVCPSKPSAYVKIKPWNDRPWEKLASVEAFENNQIPRENKCEKKRYKSHGYRFYIPFHYRDPRKIPVQVKVTVHFPECMLVLPKVHPPVRRILEEGVASDVTIVAANGVEIKAHWSFLVVQSPVLMAAYKTDMKGSKTGCVDMSDATEPGIWAFLRHLYYEDMTGPEEDAEIAFQVLYLAHKYNVGGLEAKTMQCLMVKRNECLNVEGAFKLYMFIRNLDSESAVQLKMKTIQILIAKMDELQMLQKYRDLFVDPLNAETAMQIFKDFAETRPL